MCAGPFTVARFARHNEFAAFGTVNAGPDGRRGNVIFLQKIKLRWLMRLFEYITNLVHLISGQTFFPCTLYILSELRRQSLCMNHFLRRGIQNGLR